MFPTRSDIVVLGFCVIFGLVALKRTRSRNTLPPGPKSYPIIGQLLSLPRVRWYDTFTDWQKIYGDFAHISFLGKNIFIVSSLEIADELMNKRMVNYSDRSKSIMGDKLMNATWILSRVQSGSLLTESRRILKRALGPQVVGDYSHLVESETTRLLLKFKDFTGDPFPSVLHMIGVIMVKLSYGEDVFQRSGEEIVETNGTAFKVISRAATRFWLVDAFPFLRFIPSWFPGAEFKQIGEHYTRMSSWLRSYPYDLVEKNHAAGRSGYSIAEKLFEAGEQSAIARDALATLYMAGADTTSTMITVFILLMTLYPDVKRKIQQEIDDAVGPDRLPTMEDRGRMPYLEAAWKECARWRPAVPLGLPHINAKEDIFEGYHIPKRSMVMVNIGFILRDPRIWDDPERFKPERFMPEHNPNAASLPNPLVLCFGFGQRICPGRYFADKAGLHLVASILQVYDVSMAPGKSMTEPPVFADSAISGPQDFQCVFKPRTEKAEQLLRYM